MKKIAKTFTVCMLTLAVLAGTALISAPAEAAGSPFPKTGYSNYTHNSKQNGKLIVNGVDVSTWQSGSSNWDKAKAAGVDFAIMRVTFSYYGSKNLKMDCDNKFAAMYKKAKASNMMLGIYVFSQAKNADEAVREAKYAVARLKALGVRPKDLALPVYMDYEFAGGKSGRMYGLTKTNATNAAAAFCNTIKSYGYTPGIYANTGFFRNYIDTSKIASDVDLWVAQYYSRCESGVNYSKWQYSSSAKVDGILHWTGVYKSNTDVNFWYINKSVNKKPLTTIKGKTTLSLNDAKKPKFTITNGKTVLKEGTDYIVGGIRNNRKGAAYAYIKGIGKYGGYALVPLTVTNKTSGSASANINGKCANYLTYASNAKSKFISTVRTFKKGGIYTVQDALNVRTGAGTGNAIVKRSALSSTARNVTYTGTNAVLKTGTKVKCLQVSGSWIKVQVQVSGKWVDLKGGWICTGMNGEVYVK